jgi:hypothetical protein
MLASILSSRILAMDETPVKAGNKKGGMKQAWFWPLLGDAGEIAFTFSPSRGRRHIETILQREFDGTLVSDGYSAYSSYIEANTKITHAQCWVHTRRYFLAAQEGEPDAERVLEHIAYLYRVEERITEQALSGEQKRRQRLETSKPVVDQLFAWCRGRVERGDLLPKDPLTTAIGYALKREHALRVFLEDPDVPLDNNHTERALRPIALGRKNWLFCWTEIGAEHVGIIQSLIATCKLQEVDPYTYLVDVLQRVAIHPAKKVGELTPRQWKSRFADNPLRSDIHRGVDPPGK